MPVIWAIMRRDLLQAFTTPLAWLVLAAWTFLTNGVFYLTLNSYQGTGGAERPLSLDALDLGVFFLTLLAPALTMTAFSAERAQGTMQLLMTSPIREHHLVLGKWLAVLAVLVALVAATLPHQLVLLVVSAVHGPSLIAGYLGLLLACCLFSGLGVWISLLVDSPVSAYVITFAAIAVLVLLGIMPPGTWAGTIGQALGVGAHSRPFMDGRVALGDVMYFLVGTAAFLLMAHAALQAKRIHG